MKVEICNVLMYTKIGGENVTRWNQQKIVTLLISNWNDVTDENWHLLLTLRRIR